MANPDPRAPLNVSASADGCPHVNVRVKEPREWEVLQDFFSYDLEILVYPAFL